MSKHKTSEPVALQFPLKLGNKFAIAGVKEIYPGKYVIDCKCQEGMALANNIDADLAHGDGNVETQNQ